MVERWNLGDAPKKAKGELLKFDPEKRKARSAVDEYHRKRSAAPPSVIALEKKKKEREVTPRTTRASAKRDLTDLAHKTGFEMVNNTDKRIVKKAAVRMAHMAWDMKELNSMYVPDYEQTWKAYVTEVERALAVSHQRVGSRVLKKMLADIERAIEHCKTKDSEVTDKLQGANILPAGFVRFLWRRGLVKNSPEDVTELKRYQHFLTVSRARLYDLASAVRTMALSAEIHEQKGEEAGEEP